MNDNEAVTHGSGNVFKDLDIVISREHWAELCAENGSKLPYPFADVIAFPGGANASSEDSPSNSTLTLSP